MEYALFECPTAWRPWLPPGVRGLERKEELAERTWDLLALTPAGLLHTEKGLVRCRILLLPGGCPLELAAQVRAEWVITYGLSSRDSLTLSSLEDPVLRAEDSAEARWGRSGTPGVSAQRSACPGGGAAAPVGDAGVADATDR